MTVTPDDNGNKPNMLLRIIINAFASYPCTMCGVLHMQHNIQKQKGALKRCASKCGAFSYLGNRFETVQSAISAGRGNFGRTAGS